MLACLPAAEALLAARGVVMSYWKFAPRDLVQDLWGSVGEVLHRDEGPPRPYYFVRELLNVHKKTSIIVNADGTTRVIEKDNHGREILWPVANVKGRWEGDEDALPEKPSRRVLRGEEGER